jgi:hypothetical protein
MPAPEITTPDDDEPPLRRIRYSLDLDQAEYAALCNLMCQAKLRGKHVSMRELIRNAIHQVYPSTVAS